jgi:hypothetical protein
MPVLKVSKKSKNYQNFEWRFKCSTKYNLLQSFVLSS